MVSTMAERTIRVNGGSKFYGTTKRIRKITLSFKNFFAGAKIKNQWLARAQLERWAKACSRKASV
jgi:hypothetical protein